MIVFTVMDHDVLTANDFAGEAFLALGTIPGVGDIGTGVDNFHGLKPVELILMQQHHKSKWIGNDTLCTASMCPLLACRYCVPYTFLNKFNKEALLYNPYSYFRFNIPIVWL